MRVLVFAPHPDDEVLGCGGTIARYAAEGNEVYVCTVTKGVEPLFRKERVEKTRDEQQTAHKLLGVSRNVYLDFPAAMLEEAHRYELNAAVSNVVEDIRPEIVFIPHFGDMQKDHCLVSEAAMVAVRPRGDCSVKQVYSYETLSETEWSIPHVSNAFMPNCFVDISDYLDLKLQAIDCFASQIGQFPAARSKKSVEVLASFRGSTINKVAAEAFCALRIIR